MVRQGAHIPARRSPYPGHCKSTCGRTPRTTSFRLGRIGEDEEE
jgi:hypothetical protein